MLDLGTFDFEALWDHVEDSLQEDVENCESQSESVEESMGSISA